VRLWRLSNHRHAADLSGGYGLVSDGRWNIRGRPCLYASTGAALPVLEKRVHVADPGLLPPLQMVEYDLPDATSTKSLEMKDLPDDWVRRPDVTQQMGDLWLRAGDGALLLVPSAIVPIEGAPDVNVVINPRHPEIRAMRIARSTAFSLDLRLFS
jgi:RES domain-containing protein